MKFNICHVKPPEYIYSHAFDEVSIALAAGLRDLGCSVTIQSNKIEPKARNIIIGSHLLDPSSSIMIPKNSIILNTEQLSSEVTTFNKNILYWANKYETWDYSNKNIDFLNRTLNKLPKKLILGYHEELKKIKKVTNPDIDVLFYGCINERREKIIQSLVNKGLNVKKLTGVFGIERDQWISRSKIILNVHFYETKIFEIVRCFYLMINAKAIVSEIEADTSIDDIYRPGIAGAKYNKLEDKCFRLLADDILRKTYEENAEKTMKLINQAEHLKLLLI